MFANKKNQKGAVYAYLVIAAGLISAAIFIFNSNMSSFVFLSTEINEKTKISSTITNASEAAKDYFRKRILDGSLTAFPVDTSETNSPLNGGLLPKSIPNVKTDPWGTRIGVCSYYLGSGSFPAAFGSSSNGVVRGNSVEDMNSIMFAIVIAGKNRIFETECASTSGSEVRPSKGGDDIVWMFSVNQIKIALDSAVSSGPALIQGFIDGDPLSGLSSVSATTGDVYLSTLEGSLYYYSDTSQWKRANTVFDMGSTGASYIVGRRYVKFDGDASTPPSFLGVFNNRTVDTNCSVNTPVRIYNKSFENSFGKVGFTSSSVLFITGSLYDKGNIVLAKKVTDSMNCKSGAIFTIEGERNYGLNHYAVPTYYLTPTAGGHPDYSFEDATPGWLCVSGCTTFSPTLSTKKNRRDGYYFFKPDNGVNTEIKSNGYLGVWAGNDAVITFDYSPSPGGNASTNEIILTIKDVWGATLLQTSVSESGLDLPAGGSRWKKYNWYMNAPTGGVLYIKASGAADGISGMIDNIRYHKASNPTENTSGSGIDFSFYVSRFAFGEAYAAETGAIYSMTNPGTFLFSSYNNRMGTKTLFTFKNRNLPSSDYIAPGYYNVDATTSPGRADLTRSNQLIDTPGPVTNDKCVESGYNFSAGALITDYYGNVYVCQ